MTLSHPLMVVTDLDGSLLDHHTYRWDNALSWLDRLRAREVPLVFCSSKTAAEIRPLQAEMGLEDAPFIAENGARASCLLDGERREFGQPNYGALCAFLRQLRADSGFRFTGFADATAQQVADWTGLSLANARLAMQREAAESLIWRDSEAHFAAFRQRLQQAGLQLTEGGRFWHVMPQEAGKGLALAWMLREFAMAGQTFTTLGLGDGPNDAPMLELVDYAVVIKGHSKTPVTLMRDASSRVYYATAPGPTGWSEGLSHFLL
ncbi:mannosyl-3-phosphoglycerate phosphatase-related protein [Pantoea sp. 1.19]|uniref:mannosyl-3-phosphoglycerate phosphatase-related protein n=1 Tax=Pantoea sp. 1.19 TaxID=1925589 RepID=UPI00352B5FD4